MDPIFNCQSSIVNRHWSVVYGLKKMRILFITTPDVAIDKGGLYTQIINSKKYLEKLGVEIDLFDMWYPLKYNYDLVHIFRADVSLYDTVKRLKKRGMKIVLSPIFASTHSIPMLKMINLSNELLGRTKVFSLHSFVKKVMEGADTILPNTDEEIKALSLGFGIPRVKFRKIPNGVDESFCFANPDEFKDKYAIENFILYTGWIGSARKNTLNLVRALAKIDKEAIFIGRIIDEGDYTKRCLSLAKKNPKIKILEPLTHDSPLLASAYAACDTFVLPSLYETPGLSALEAALAGAKVVITGRGGTREYFGNMAEYVNPCSVRSIREAIGRSISKKKDKRLREHIRKNFLWERVAQRLYETYLRVV